MADKLVFTPIADIPGIVANIKKNYETHKTKDYDYRIGQLKALRNMLVKEEKRWLDAMDKDLRQNQFLKLIEMKYCISDIDDAIANLYDWMQPEARSNNQLANMPGTASLYKEPFGTVLIIAPWNYPIQLCIRPLVGAIAAGNAAIIKPSEVSENCARCFSDLVPQYLDKDCYAVVQGGVAETKELLKIRFDYIFYTGNPMVGKEIMKAAAEFLTPVTLELGGKSPVIIDKNVNLDAAVRRVMWGKMLNVGQSCIAPDYILVHKSHLAEFVEKAKKQLNEWYSNGEFEKDENISRIISARHTERLKKLLDGAVCKQKIGGKVDVENKFIEPTLIVEPALDCPIMQEEIFGPLLPIVPIESIEDAIAFINKREKPLALYIFSSDRRAQEKILKETSSGTVAINETMLQFCVPDLPFGGVGQAGFGSYNGKTSFDTFTHNKSVLERPTWLELPVRFPPYSSGKVSVLNMVLGKSLPTLSSIAKWTLPVVIPVVSAAAYYYSKM